MASFASLTPLFEKGTPVLRLTRGAKDPKAKWVPGRCSRGASWRPFRGSGSSTCSSGRCSGSRAPGSSESRTWPITSHRRRSRGAGGGRAPAHGARRSRRGADRAGPAGRWTRSRRTTRLDEARVGHVLSDPFTGRLWPRFPRAILPVTDVELNDGGWPVLVSGSAGDPWRDPTFSVLPASRDAVVLARPRAHDVLRAARRHRRQRYRDEPMTTATCLCWSASPSSTITRSLTCSPCGCASTAPATGWSTIRFGHGEALDLRARLEERLDHHEGLRRWLAPLRRRGPVLRPRSATSRRRPPGRSRRG